MDNDVYVVAESKDTEMAAMDSVTGEEDLSTNVNSSKSILLIYITLKL